MEFVKLNGWVEKNSDFISIEIKNGKNSDSVGDQIWISQDGTEMEVHCHSDSEVIEDTARLFSNSNHRNAFKGALRRMGMQF